MRRAAEQRALRRGAMPFCMQAPLPTHLSLASAMLLLGTVALLGRC